jgi:hypothetical protein
MTMSPNDFLTSLNIVNGTRDLPELRHVFVEHMKKLTEHAKELAPKPVEEKKPEMPKVTLPPERVNTNLHPEAKNQSVTAQPGLTPVPTPKAPDPAPAKPIEHPLFSEGSSSSLRRPGGSDNAP